MQSRRQFLAGAAGAASLFPLRNYLWAAAHGARTHAGYGPLQPVADETTGLELLKLPAGFRYQSFGWTGEAMRDGTPTPERHDGMAVIQAQGDRLTLVRNHEIASDQGAFGPPTQWFDPAAGGGTTNLVFDAAKGAWVESYPSLSGTLINCAGGATPWGTWLSCEEVVLVTSQHTSELERAHGYVFEVPVDGAVNPQPIFGMGQFVHEAVAVDPETGIAYLTEDRNPGAGFYRFLPREPGRYLAGGQLQAMRVASKPDMRSGLDLDVDYDVDWVDIENPQLGHNPNTFDRSGVFTQGARAGASRFTRLEGCWERDRKIYFTATNGGDAQAGQVFAFDPVASKIRLVYESPGHDLLDSPDNITASPRGGLVLCEDGSRIGAIMHGLTPAGELYPLAQNNVNLSAGQHAAFSGDFRGSEWCGACFSPDGQWLFANIQTPGITVAITGPWDDALG